MKRPHFFRVCDRCKKLNHAATCIMHTPDKPVRNAFLELFMSPLDLDTFFRKFALFADARCQKESKPQMTQNAQIHRTTSPKHLCPSVKLASPFG